MPIPKEEYQDDLVWYCPDLMNWREGPKCYYVLMEQIEEYHTEEEIEKFKTWINGQPENEINEIKKFLGEDTVVKSQDGKPGVFAIYYEEWISKQMPGER